MRNEQTRCVGWYWYRESAGNESRERRCEGEAKAEWKERCAALSATVPVRGRCQLVLVSSQRKEKRGGTYFCSSHLHTGRAYVSSAARERRGPRLFSNSLSVVERTDLARLEPARNAVEVERVLQGEGGKGGMSAVCGEGRRSPRTLPRRADPTAFSPALCQSPILPSLYRSLFSPPSPPTTLPPLPATR